jgi:hypothetical protein
MVIDPPTAAIHALDPEGAKRIADKARVSRRAAAGNLRRTPGPISPRRSERRPTTTSIASIALMVRRSRRSGALLRRRVPVVLGTGTFGGVMQLVQSPDSCRFYYDVGQGSGFAWVVPITKRPHLPRRRQLYRGDPIGHWEATRSSSTSRTSATRRTSARAKNLHLV